MLKGTKIFLNDDLCPDSVEIRKSLLPKLKEERNKGNVAFFVNTRIVSYPRTNQDGNQADINPDQHPTTSQQTSPIHAPRHGGGASLPWSTCTNEQTDKTTHGQQQSANKLQPLQVNQDNSSHQELHDYPLRSKK